MKHCIAAVLMGLGIGMAPLAQAATAPAKNPPVVLPASEQWDMTAQANGQQYRIFVAAPERPAPASGYRVLYVMDGNAMFLTAVEALRARGGDRRRGQTPDGEKEVQEMQTVVVGIGYPPGTDIALARARDLSLPGVSEPRVRGASGGSDAFLAFIEKELKPAIASKYPIDPARQAIFGHSLGGLFTLHVLATRADVFQTYLAASPSIWYAGRAIRKELDAFAHKRANPSPQVRVLLTAGQYEQSLDPAEAHLPHAAKAAADLKARAQVDNGREVVAQLAALPNIEAEFVEFAGETHPSVIPAAISRGVRYLLAGTAPSVQVPPMPTAQEYFAMTPEQRYQLRMQVRSLPDAQRIPWVTRQYHVLHDGLSAEQLEALHKERNEMDGKHGTKPHSRNAQLDKK